MGNVKVIQPKSVRVYVNPDEVREWARDIADGHSLLVEGKDDEGNTVEVNIHLAGGQ